MANCNVCGEPMPPHSRLCPHCLLNDSYSVDIKEFETPVEMLSIMRNMVDEYLESDAPTNQEAVATFEAVRDVVMITFGKNRDVVEAVGVMEDLLYEHVELRRQSQINRRRWLFVVVISVIILISSLFVIAY